jgi:hypothetical protein
MKTIFRLVISALLVLAADTAQAAGYVSVPMSALPNFNYFVNPLYNSYATNLSELFAGQVPAGATVTVALWNPTLNEFDRVAACLGNDVWSDDFPLLPGSGARLTTSVAFNVVFVGEVLNHDGSLFEGVELTLPPPFSGPNGIYLLGDKSPIASNGAEIFTNILGRGPNIGEQITPDNNTTSTYLGGGAWNIVPSLSYGRAAFFNIGPVQPPSPSQALRIHRLSPLQAQLTWSTSFPSDSLHFATNLPALHWMRVTNMPAIVGDHFALTIDLDRQERYFTLRPP